MKFYLIDKPLDLTSFDVIRVLRKKLNTSKMWHTWTLDPLATGGLLIAVWKYTKLIPFFEKDTKEYEFSVKFDWITESFDLWTDVQYISEDEQKNAKNIITKEKIEFLLKEKFTWKISQIPPKYSALKLWWKKALERIKAGEEFEMKSREVNIEKIELLWYSYPEASFKATVSAWTYIRSIAFDLWEMFWTGWYVTKLRRTKIWALDISLSQWLDNFDEKKSLNVKDLFKNKSFITLENEVLDKINNWLKVKWNFSFNIWEDLFVFDWNNVTNIVEYDWVILKAKRKI
jgi:tRNA pseudouridine55 synthase